jgi:toxin ParE1/3/4
MTKCAVSLAESALSDLQAIHQWYLDEGVPAVGRRLVNNVLNRLDTLSDHPLIGRQVPEFDSPSLRELIMPPFRIVYRHEPGKVRIVRVWRSERLLTFTGDE